MPTRISHSVIILRPHRRSILVFVLVALGILFVSSIWAPKSDTFIYGAALYVALWSLAIYALASIKIVMDGDILHYSPFGRRSIKINKNDVIGIRLPKGYFDHELVIEQSSRAPVSIHLKPFGKDDTRLIIEFFDRESM